MSAVQFGATGGAMGSAIAVDSSGQVYLVGTFQGTMAVGDGPALSAPKESTFWLRLDPSLRPTSARVLDGVAADIAVDVDGNVWVAGRFEGAPVDFGTGPLRCAGVHDFYLLKLDRDGHTIWAARYGDGEDQYGIHVTAHPRGGVVVSGWFRGAVDFGGGPLRSYPDKATFVARLDSTGKHLWSRRFGRIVDFATTDVAVRPTGEVIVSGGSDATPEFGGRPDAQRNDLGITLVELDGLGKTVRARRFGGGMDNLYTALRLEARGDIALAGTHKTTLDFGAGPLQPLDHESVYVAKFDETGKALLSRSLIGASIASVAGMLDEADGSTIVGGQLYFSTVFRLDAPKPALPETVGFVEKRNSHGERSWQTILHANPRQGVSGLAFDSKGNVLVMGFELARNERRELRNRVFLATLAR